MQFVDGLNGVEMVDMHDYTEDNKDKSKDNNKKRKSKDDDDDYDD